MDSSSLSRRTCKRARQRVCSDLGSVPTKPPKASKQQRARALRRRSSARRSREEITGGRRQCGLLGGVCGLFDLLLQYSWSSPQAIGEEIPQWQQEGACALSSADWPQNLENTCVNSAVVDEANRASDEKTKKKNVVWVYLKPGVVYEGQLVVSEGQHVVITSDSSEHAVLRHFTSSPYEPVVKVLTGGILELSHVTLSHSSPSVASNYAVEVGYQASLDCFGTEITSETGSGVCVLGGRAKIESCVIKNCKEHGIACYDDLESEQGSVVTIRDSVIEGCKGYGIQARGEDVQVSVSASRLSKNKDEIKMLQGATVKVT